jgi:hypothetical protein
VELYEFILIALTLSIVAADILMRLRFDSERRDESVERLLTVLGPATHQSAEQTVRQESAKEFRGLFQAR